MNEPKTNPRNDRVKREYLIWLKEANQRSSTTVEQVRHAIDRFETYTRFKDFGTFRREQAIGFKDDLVATLGQRSGTRIRIATVLHTLQAIKNFMAWLHTQPGYRRCIRPADIAYLSVTKGEERQARASTPKQFASYDEFRTALFAMPAQTEIERRDQAIMALLLMIGIRDAAIIGLKVKDVDLAKRYVFQDPRHACTKFRKAIDSFFLPVGDDVIAVFTGWVDYLKDQKGFGPDYPVFPKTVVEPGTFGDHRLGQQHWANATPVRQCFKDAFAHVGLPFTKPHTVRDTLTQLAYRRKFDIEQMKALSQNLGHDSPMTTFGNYGQLTRERQGEVIRDLAYKPTGGNLDAISATDLAEALAARLKGQGG